MADTVPLSLPVRRAGATHAVTAIPAVWLLPACLALAWVVRAPALLFSELNWDESLYRLIGDSLADGHAPYVEFWDRKPVGIFLIMAVVKLLFGGGLLAVRTVTAFAVGLTGWLLILVGREIFPDDSRIGIAASVLCICFSVRNGGAGGNTELFYVPTVLAGLYVAFAAERCGGPRFVTLALLSGLLMGAAVQIKETAIFDILGYAAIFLITRTRRLDRPTVMRHARQAAITTVGIVTPTLLIVLWYAVIGRLDTYFKANFLANVGLLGDTAPDFNLDGMLFGLHDFDTLVLGAVLAVVLGAVLVRDRTMRRGWLALCCWLLAMAASLAFSRRFADHFFQEVLPALATATSFGLCLIARTWLPRRLAGVALAAVVGLAALRADASSFHGAEEMLWRRKVDGVAFWGDRTATIAAAIRPRLRGPYDVYVFGRLLGLYHACDTIPPTRFPFSSHLYSKYAPVDGDAEIARILAAAPRFIVVDDNWLAQMDSGAPTESPANDKVFAAMHRALLEHYVVDGRVPPFRSWGGGDIEGSIGATVFRRDDTPGFAFTPTLYYLP